jgi:hypothetical protein
MDLLQGYYNNVDDVAPPSTALAFVTKIIVKGKYISPSEIQLQNWQKTISTEEKLDVIS